MMRFFDAHCDTIGPILEAGADFLAEDGRGGGAGAGREDGRGGGMAAFGARGAPGAKGSPPSTSPCPG